MSTPYQPSGGAPCAACGTPFEVGDRFCMGCGAPAASPAAAAAAAPAAASAPVCGFCGEALVPGDSFCAGCGQRAAVATPSPVGTPVTYGAEPSVVGYCEQCGGTLELDDVFCQSCGRPVAAAPAAAGSMTATVLEVRRPTAQPAALPQRRETTGPAVCPACGMQLGAGERFCGSCGRLIKRAGQS